MTLGKGQKVKYHWHVNFKDFYTKLCVCSHKWKIENILNRIFILLPRSCPGVGLGGVKNFGVGICDGAPSTARSSLCCFFFVFVMISCASVYWCLVVTLLRKVWHLGSRLWCLFVSLSLSNVVSLVRCDIWLYRFLIFGPLISYLDEKLHYAAFHLGLCCL